MIPFSATRKTALQRVRRFFLLSPFLVGAILITPSNAPSQRALPHSPVGVNPITGGRAVHPVYDNVALPHIAASSNSKSSGVLDPEFNTSVTEGSGFVFESAVQSDGKIIAVGHFQHANAKRVNGIARYNADGTLDNTFETGAGANAQIFAVAVQPDGKILLGGAFTTFNGQATPRIVRLNADGGIDDTFVSQVQFNSSIFDIALQPDGRILVGGQFFVSSSRLVRLTVDGSLDTTFAGAWSVVFAVAIEPSGKVIAGGERDFSFPAALRRFSSDGSVDPSFTPGKGPDSTVFRLALQPDGKIIASGAFRTFDGASTDGIVRLSNNGTLETTFDHIPGQTLTIYEFGALTIQADGKIILGITYFDAGQEYSKVVRFDPDGSIDPTFTQGNPDGYQVMDTLMLDDGKILASGFFVEYNGETRLRLARLNSDGSNDMSFSGSASAVATVVAVKPQPDSKILIAGLFEFVNGVRTRGGIARVNADGTLDTTFVFEPGIYGYISALVLQPDGKIIIGNSSIGVLRLNSDGSRDPTFELEYGGYHPYSVNSIALQADGKILVGGMLTGLTGNVLTARYNSDGSLDDSFTTHPANFRQVLSILVQPDNRIVIGGSFIPTANFPRTSIARLEPSGILADGFYSASGFVRSVTQQPDGKVIAAGDSLARYHSNGDLDTTLNIGSGFNQPVYSVIPEANGKILAAGAFTTFNGKSVNRLIRIHPNGTLDSSLNIGSGPSGRLGALERQQDGKLVVGGQFDSFDGVQKFGLVRLLNVSPSNEAPFDFDGDGKTDVSIFRPANGEWWYGKSSDGGHGAAAFGTATDVIVPADYTGDGKTDIAFFRPSTGEWFVLRSEDFLYYSFPFGSSGDIPAPADYDGDGKADVAVYRPSTGTWYILRSSDGQVVITGFGVAGDQPVPADYDGDGKADIGVFRPNGPSGAEWWILRSTEGLLAVQFGSADSKAVPGDYTGDGKADVAFFSSTGGWYILRSEDMLFYSFPFGLGSDLPVPGDYDGDGKIDAAVFRNSEAAWYMLGSTSGTIIRNFGASGDRPVPNAFVR